MSTGFDDVLIKIVPRSIGFEIRRARLQAESLERAFVGVTSGEAVGFLSNLLRTGSRLVRGFLGIPTRVTPGAIAPVISPAVTAVAGSRVVRVARGAAGLAAAGGAFAVGETAVQQLLGTGEATVAPGAIAGGNGRTVRQTIIVTRDAATGATISAEMRQGAPFLMGRDVQIANRVFRQSVRLQRRLPKKVVKQSARSALLNNVVDNALKRASCP